MTEYHGPAQRFRSGGHIEVLVPQNQVEEHAAALHRPAFMATVEQVEDHVSKRFNMFTDNQTLSVGTLQTLTPPAG